MNRLNRLLLASACASLCVLPACNGDGGPPGGPAAASALVYTEPASGSYQLRRSAALSTATHLVLELVGPAATKGSGVVATFNADGAKVSWSKVAAADAGLVQNGAAFNLGAAPQILRARVAGDVLETVASQKGTASPVPLDVPLLRVALDLKPAQAPGPVALGADAGKCQLLDAAGGISTIAIAVGALAAQ